MLKAAAYFDKLDDGKVMCRLCPADCRLSEGQRGICRSRFNQGGELVTDNYGELVTLAVDPIEKKPLYHFYPGSMILSTGPNCCNLGCMHCQNWTISQKAAATVYFSPDRLLETTLSHDSIGVAFTYTEPMVWFEYLLDTAPLLRDEGLKVVLVTNGYINPEPLQELLPLVDAMNIDLKSMRERFYRHICKGRLAPVLENIRRVAQSGTHLEITNLIIPGENDSQEDLTDLIEFVASISDMIPVHFSAYRPDYKLDHASTPPETLLRAAKLAASRLKYVYLGNVWLREGTDTVCPQCGSLLVERSGFRATVIGLRGSRCAACNFDTGIRND
ncbi:MAG TPA: AmmeMemoRadiSam system radical SAM enzyme [Acidobacteriota bacterium]|nr:AmmeMemoRadiSam system radical SAM enzyme [Acidobacteriota bacterium]